MLDDFHTISLCLCHAIFLDILMVNQLMCICVSSYVDRYLIRSYYYYFLAILTFPNTSNPTIHICQCFVYHEFTKGEEGKTNVGVRCKIPWEVRGQKIRHTKYLESQFSEICNRGIPIGKPMGEQADRPEQNVQMHPTRTS